MAAQLHPEPQTAAGPLPGQQLSKCHTCALLVMMLQVELPARMPYRPSPPPSAAGLVCPWASSSQKAAPLMAPPFCATCTPRRLHQRCMAPHGASALDGAPALRRLHLRMHASALHGTACGTGRRGVHLTPQPRAMQDYQHQGIMAGCRERGWCMHCQAAAWLLEQHYPACLSIQCMLAPSAQRVLATPA